MSERRLHRRIGFDGRAYLTFNGQCRAEDVLDVSAGGLQLRSSARIRPGKRVKIFLPLPASKGWRLCFLKGEVVRRARGESGDSRIGIQLCEAEADNRELLAAFVGA